MPLLCIPRAEYWLRHLEQTWRPVQDLGRRHLCTRMPAPLSREALLQRSRSSGRTPSTVASKPLTTVTKPHLYKSFPQQRHKRDVVCFRSTLGYTYVHACDVLGRCHLEKLWRAWRARSEACLPSLLCHSWFMSRLCRREDIISKLEASWKQAGPTTLASCRIATFS